MRYLGVAKTSGCQILMPDKFQGLQHVDTYEVLEVEGHVILLPGPLDRERIARVERLARQSIQDHREALESLAS